jgi:hypothetical protein
MRRRLLSALIAKQVWQQLHHGNMYLHMMMGMLLATTAGHTMVLHRNSVAFPQVCGVRDPDHGAQEGHPEAVARHGRR